MRRRRTSTAFVVLQGLVGLLWVLAAQPSWAEETRSPSMESGLTLHDPPSLVRATGSGRAPSEARIIAAEGTPGPVFVAQNTPSVPHYVPPRRGAPHARAGGGSRGARALPTPTALAPPHLADTAVAQPSVFWHVDEGPVEGTHVFFTLNDEDSLDPLVETELPTPTSAGIQRVRLADLGVELAPEREYEWAISLIADPSRRSGDSLSVGYIRRSTGSPVASLANPSADEFATHGLWYDALEAVSDEVDAAPGASAPRQRRNALLRQAELDVAMEAVEPNVR